MIDSRWVAPALLFFAGAVVGRVIGLKPIVSGAVGLAALAGGGGGEPDRAHHKRVPSRKITHRAAHRRPVAKRSRAA